MNTWLYEKFYEPLTEVYFQEALIGGSLVAIACGVIGCFVILRRMAFLGDAISHAMLAGVASGYLFMRLFFDKKAHAPAMMIGALIAAVVTVGLIGFVSRVSRLKEDTIIGIMYTGIFAAGGVLVSLFADLIHIHLYHFVMGSVLAINDEDLWLAAWVAAAVLTIVILFFRHLQLTSFDPVMAASIGIPVALMDYVLTTCTAFVVVSGVSMVGIILVVGLLVTPAATAYLLCDRLSSMLVLAASFGVTSVIGGLYLALWMNVGASAIVFFSTFQFMVVLIIAPRYGMIADWLRRRRMVPQRLVEDVLSSVLRSEGTPVSMATLQSYIQGPHDQIERAVKALFEKSLLQARNAEITLTETGKREAMRLRRAHRIWETYLKQMGMSAGELHEGADHLEHVHDEGAIDYLDDKLGHPIHDPHGAVIPEDFVDVVPGKTVKVSLLREGQQAIVEKLTRPIGDNRLEPGMRIRIGPRRENGNVWTVLPPDGIEVLLNHQAADALLVRVQEEGDDQ